MAPRKKKGSHGSNTRNAEFFKKAGPLLQYSFGGHVKIPVLRCRLKGTAPAFPGAGPRTLQDLQLPRRCGVHVAKVKRGWPLTHGKVDYPCNMDQLQPGESEIWILPETRAQLDLEPMEVEQAAITSQAEEACRKEAREAAAEECNACLRRGFNHIYELVNMDAKSVRLTSGTSSGTGLAQASGDAVAAGRFRTFMAEFGLKEHDLHFDTFDAFTLTYPPEAPEAVIGTLRIAARVSAVAGRRVRALDIRRTFGLSPIAVVRGGNTPAGGRWELPARPDTILSSGDRFVFLFPGAGSGNVDPGGHQAGSDLGPLLRKLVDARELRKLPSPGDFGIVIYHLHETTEEAAEGAQIVAFGAIDALMREELLTSMSLDEALPPEVLAFLRRAAGASGHLAMVSHSREAGAHAKLSAKLAELGMFRTVHFTHASKEMAGMLCLDAAQAPRLIVEEDFHEGSFLSLSNLHRQVPAEQAVRRDNALACCEAFLQVLTFSTWQYEVTDLDEGCARVASMRTLLAEKVAEAMHPPTDVEDDLRAKAEVAWHWHIANCCFMYREQPQAVRLQ